jgi:hypothetical protein
MSAPGGGFGEGGHDDEANSAPAGGRVPEQPAWQPPWDTPAADYPPQAYAPPGYPPEHPPPVSPPPGYGQPPGYGGPPYPPVPPQFGGPPPGYGPPPYPGGYPGGYHPTDYQGRAGTNGLAIASLVSSFTGFLCCFIGSIAAIVLGAIALSQIRQTREEGHGLAVAGIAIGVGTLVVFVIIALFSIIPANSH